MKKILVLLGLLTFTWAFVTVELDAQEIKFPKLSQKASISQEIGLTEISLTYHRPGVKERVIWGELVSYDKIWRTGANNATTIRFGNDVKVEGQPLKAGTYGLFTIPGKEVWTIVFSKQSDIWGTYGYKEEQDVLRVKVKPETHPQSVEWMMFAFSDLTENSAKINLKWEKLSIGFSVKVDTKKMVLGSIQKTMDRYWVPPYSSANYMLANNIPEKAKELIDRSVTLKPIYWNMLLKAKIYHKLAKTNKAKRQATKILEKAIFLGKKLPKRQQGYVEEAKKLYTEWTGKKAK